MNFRYDKEEEKLVVSSASRIEYHQMKIWLTRHVKGYRFMPAFKMGIWNGQQSYFDNGKVNLGLWKECYKACKEIDVTFNIENRDEFPINRDVTLESVQEFCKDFFKYHRVKDKDGNLIPFMPYDYQIETAYKILKNRYCMAEVATSGGKSLIISIVYFYTLKKLNPDAKLLIIVPSITLVTQFYDDIKSYFYGQNNINKIYDYEIEIELVNGTLFRKNPSDIIKTNNRGEIKSMFIEETDIIDNISIKRISKIKIKEPLRIEEVMSDKPRKPINENPNIYISTYQSLSKYPKSFFHQFHTVVVDEAHTCKANTLTKILEKTFKNAYNRFGVSGTFPPDESLEILSIQSLLGPKVTEVSASELRDKGVITPMEIKSIIMNHNDSEFKQRLDYIKRGGNGKLSLEMEKSYIHQSEKRMNVISKIVNKCNNNVLILFHTIEYGHKLLEYLSNNCPNKEFYYIDGSIKNKEREAIKKSMEIVDNNKVKVLIASYMTLSTGVSIKNLHYLILSDSFKSEQIVIQSIGRLLRLIYNKNKAVIFDLVDIFDPKNLNNILYRHYDERKKFYTKRKYPFIEKKINL